MLKFPYYLILHRRKIIAMAIDILSYIRRKIINPAERRFQIFQRLSRPRKRLFTFTSFIVIQLYHFQLSFQDDILKVNKLFTIIILYDIDKLLNLKSYIFLYGTTVCE